MEEKNTFHAGTNYTPLPGGKTHITVYAEGGKIVRDEIVSTEEAMRELEATNKQQEMNDFEALHGPSYPYAKYQIGDTIRFADPETPSGRNSGRVLHVIAPAEKRSCAYIVLPDRVCFPTEIFADEVIEE